MWRRRSDISLTPEDHNVAVGLVVPEDFPLRGLLNDEERAVVEALRDRLSDDWLVFPDVALATDRRDHQIDVVLAHPREGVAVIEVKGHRVQLRNGQFVPDRGQLPSSRTSRPATTPTRCGTGSGPRRRSWPR
jgi:Nuclease-related domain